MEPHPVPQNITSFEFHLVGNMTLKQFAYLASGLVTAYFLFIFLFPVAPVIAVPLMAISSLFGVSFAFLPIFDRPLSHWLKSYLTAVYSPTLAAWMNPYTQKTSDASPAYLNSRLQVYLTGGEYSHVQASKTLKLIRLTPPLLQPPIPNITPQSKPNQVQPTPPPESPKPATLSPLNALRQGWPVKLGTLPAENTPSSEELDKILSIAMEAEDTRKKYLQAKAEIAQLKGLLQQRNITPLAAEVKPASPIAKTIPQIIPKPAHIVVVDAPKKTNTQLMLTSYPNVINGVVTDSAGNYLEGVIVIIHNKDNIPVRALKTNKLGQFAGATPLIPGLYTVTLEKDNLEFDTFQVTLNNEVLSPIKISAKRVGVVHG